LLAIRSEIEMSFNRQQVSCSCSQINSFFHPVVPSLLSAKQRKQYLINGCMMETKLYVSNLELPKDFDKFNLGQVYQLIFMLLRGARLRTYEIVTL